VEGRRGPDLFLSYMAHETPRLAWNRAGAASTNLIHGVYLKNPTWAEDLAANWQNPATALSAELEGRTYGGGVLKMETKEAERTLVPAPRSAVDPDAGRESRPHPRARREEGIKNAAPAGRAVNLRRS